MIKAVVDQHYVLLVFQVILLFMVLYDCVEPELPTTLQVELRLYILTHTALCA